MSNISRRRFLEDSLFAAAAATFASSCASRSGTVGAGAPGAITSGTAAKAAAPSDLLRVAVVGVNGRGMAHVRDFAKRKDVQVAAICDVDEQAFTKAHDAVLKATGKAPVFERDLRKLLEDRSIDVISVATPNHWHSLAAVWAIQAGKDVYLEKPVSHNVHEGRVVVDMARKHGRIVQTGSQSRSNPGMRQFIDYVQSGKLGKVTLARGLCYKGRKSIGKVASAAAPPASVNYDLWLGPAAARTDVPRERFHYDWHWQWDYGGGDIANQGSHEIDKARWGLGKTTLPTGVVSLGGRFGYQDDGQTPNTQIAVYDYGDAQLVFEVRGLNSEGLQGAKVGNIFYGSEGYAVSTNYSSGTIFDLEGQQAGPLQRRRRPHRQLHQGRPLAQAHRPHLRHRGGTPVGGAVPPGQHQLPSGQAATAGPQAQRPGRTGQRGGVRPLRAAPARQRNSRRQDPVLARPQADHRPGQGDVQQRRQGSGRPAVTRIPQRLRGPRARLRSPRRQHPEGAGRSFFILGSGGGPFSTRY